MERKDAAELLGDPQDWNERLKGVTQEYIQDCISAGVREGAIEAGLPPDTAVVNPDVIAWADRYNERLARRVNNTSKERLQASMNRVMKLYEARTVQEAIDKGSTVKEFRTAIEDALGDETNAYRAEMTAVTEFARAQQTGRLDQLREAGAVRKVWRANPDCCDFCASLDGTEAGLDDNFLSVGDSVTIDGESGTMSLAVDYDDVDIALLHPWCRCTFSAVFEGSGEE